MPDSIANHYVHTVFVYRLVANTRQALAGGSFNNASNNVRNDTTTNKRNPSNANTADRIRKQNLIASYTGSATNRDNCCCMRIQGERLQFGERARLRAG